MRRLLATYALLLFVGCYNHTDTPSLDTPLPVANCTIAKLQNSVSPLDVSIIEQEIVVVGRVTSSDSEGNFHKSLTIEDHTGGLELLVGEYNLATLYPEGLEVALKLGGCAAQLRYGVVQVGRKSESYDSSGVDHISSQQSLDRIIVRGSDVRAITAPRRRVSELTPQDCGRLCCIEDLELIASTSVDTLRGEGLDLAHWSGYAMFRDSNNDTLVIYTSNYASYGQHRIPTERVSLTGIVEYGSYVGKGNYYQIKMRYEEDCVVY